MPRRFKFRWAIFLLLVPAIPLLPLVACQHKLIYHPRPYNPVVPRAFADKGGQAIEARTGQGKQTAWLLAPRGATTQRLWLVCAGNAALSLEMRDVIEPNLAADDAVLYFDYPGYGLNEGSANPQRLRESLRAILPQAALACGIPEKEIPGRVMVFGHSLGAAVGLLAIEEFALRRAVLISPFTSSMDMAKQMLGLPLGFVVTHRFDNRAAIATLTARGGKSWILHGEDDEIIPASMASELATIGGKSVHLILLPGVGHNNIFDVAPHAVADAMREIRKSGE